MLVARQVIMKIFSMPFARVVSKPMLVMAIFFLEYRPGRSAPSLRPLSNAESAARLFAHALNPLAHPEHGLAGAAAIAQSVPSFCLKSGDLSLTCELIAETLEAQPLNTGLR